MAKSAGGAPAVSPAGDPAAARALDQIDAAIAADFNTPRLVAALQDALHDPEITADGPRTVIAAADALLGLGLATLDPAELGPADLGRGRARPVVRGANGPTCWTCSPRFSPGPPLSPPARQNPSTASATGPPGSPPGTTPNLALRHPPAPSPPHLSSTAEERPAGPPCHGRPSPARPDERPRGESSSRRIPPLEPVPFRYSLLDPGDQDGGGVDPFDAGGLVGGEQWNALPGEFFFQFQRVECVAAGPLDVFADDGGEFRGRCFGFGEKVGHSPVAGMPASANARYASPWLRCSRSIAPDSTSQYTAAMNQPGGSHPWQGGSGGGGRRGGLGGRRWRYGPARRRGTFRPGRRLCRLLRVV